MSPEKYISRRSSILRAGIVCWAIQITEDLISEKIQKYGPGHVEKFGEINFEFNPGSVSALKAYNPIKDPVIKIGDWIVVTAEKNSTFHFSNWKFRRFFNSATPIKI